jgi:hypothetical protein
MNSLPNHKGGEGENEIPKSTGGRKGKYAKRHDHNHNGGNPLAMGGEGEKMEGAGNHSSKMGGTGECKKVIVNPTDNSETYDETDVKDLDDNGKCPVYKDTTTQGGRRRRRKSKKARKSRKSRKSRKGGKSRKHN